MEDKTKIGLISLTVLILLIIAYFILDIQFGEKEPRHQIEFQLTNNLDTPIYSQYPWPWHIYKLEGSEWVEISTSRFPGCPCDIVCGGCPGSHIYSVSLLPPSCNEIKPGENISFSWSQQQVFDTKKLCGLTLKDCVGWSYVPMGRYKVKTCYSLKCIEDEHGYFEELDEETMKCLEREFDIPYDGGEITLFPNEY
jgi:hypothetical protein